MPNCPSPALLTAHCRYEPASGPYCYHLILKQSGSIVIVDVDIIQKFINSPPGAAVAGAALASSVWKAFDKIESILSDQTKLEIAVWLVGLKTSQKVRPWPNTFATNLRPGVWKPLHLMEMLWFIGSHFLCDRNPSGHLYTQPISHNAFNVSSY
jgi:hypothetical protein